MNFKEEQAEATETLKLINAFSDASGAWAAQQHSAEEGFCFLLSPLLLMPQEAIFHAVSYTGSKLASKARGLRVLIIDNYDSFTYNLVQLYAVITGVAPVILCNDAPREEIDSLLPHIDFIVISPGPGRPEREEDFGACRRLLLQSEIPVFGVCLGLQGLAHVYGCEISTAREPMHGRLSCIDHDGGALATTSTTTGAYASLSASSSSSPLSSISPSLLFEGVPQGFSAVRYNSLVVSRHALQKCALASSCLRVCAWSRDDPDEVMGLVHVTNHVAAVQFHPESVCSEMGARIMENFAKR